MLDTSLNIYLICRASSKHVFKDNYKTLCVFQLCGDNTWWKIMIEDSTHHWILVANMHDFIIHLRLVHPHWKQLVPYYPVWVYLVQSTSLCSRYQIYYSADFDCTLVQIEHQLVPQYSIFNPYIDSGSTLVWLCRDWSLRLK